MLSLEADFQSWSSQLPPSKDRQGLIESTRYIVRQSQAQGLLGASFSKANSGLLQPKTQKRVKFSLISWISLATKLQAIPSAAVSGAIAA